MAFDHAVPVCPVGVDDDRVVGKLDEERGVADPGDADFAFFGCVWDGLALFAVAFLEDLGEESVAQEVVVSSWPSFFREYACVVVTRFGLCLFGSRLGHGLEI